MSKFRFVCTREIPPKIVPRFAGTLFSIYSDYKLTEIVCSHNKIDQFSFDELENLARYAGELLDGRAERFRGLFDCRRIIN